MIFEEEVTNSHIGKKFKIVKKSEVRYPDDFTIEGDIITAIEMSITYHVRYVSGEGDEWFYLHGSNQLEEVTDE